jgi:hypothetical protein
MDAELQKSSLEQIYINTQNLTHELQSFRSQDKKLFVTYLNLKRYILNLQSYKIKELFNIKEIESIEREKWGKELIYKQMNFLLELYSM